jgi:DNA-binding transcriptional ArsR family regulator
MAPENRPGPQLSEDRLYRALAARRRRRVLYVLLVQEESTVGELATLLAGWGATESGTMATPDDRERIVDDLESVHLPVLADAGMVDYDREREAVRLAPLAPSVTELICQSVETEG